MAAAAEELGLARNSLYERVYALGLRLDPLRRKPNVTSHVAQPVTTERGAPGNVRTVKVSEPAIFPRRASAPTLAPMETAEAESAQGPRPRPGVIRLQPPQVDELRDAKFDYQAKHRVEASESDLLQRFFRECFPEWRKRTCGTEKAKAKA